MGRRGPGVLPQVEMREQGDAVNPELLRYLNRLSDLLWLVGRLVEQQAGVNARLRNEKTPGARWSRAW